MDEGDKQQLIQLIVETESCGCKHLKTVTVKEVFQGKTVWEGEVEVFELIDHPKAKLCYGWGHAPNEDETETEDGWSVLRQFHLILGLPPVDSPQKAVQVYIASGQK